MDKLALTVTYCNYAVQTFLFRKRLCWVEAQVNAAFGQTRSIVDDGRAIRTVDYEALCEREGREMGFGAGTIILFESGLAIAASDREERAKHLRGLLVAAAECRALTEHLGIHEHAKFEGAPR